jgi:FMN phosphatase YigB (HAD superfamily)
LSIPAAQIRWLFFDLRNTLVDEEAATAARLQQIVACFERHGHMRINAAPV